MDDAHDAKPEQSPYIRLPWALVAAALGGVLVLAVGLGLFADRYLRPQLGAAPTPVPAIAASEPTQAPPPVTPAPTVAPTPVDTPFAVAAPTQPPATAPPGTTAPAAPTAAATTVPTPRPTVSPELATEIGNAYETYWQVRAEALYSLDTSRLGEVMAGEHLAAVEDRIAELRAEGKAFETDVDHNYAVFEASADEVKVADSYVDRSIYVDLQTHAQLTTARDETFNEVYIMNKTDGRWRVTIVVGSP